MKTYEEINEKIRDGKAVVFTAEEIIPQIKEKGAKRVSEEVDVVTTGTFGAMCSSGVFLNFGHADPPIKMQKIWLNDVPAYGGLAAVDVYLGATEVSEVGGMSYGGGHVIEDLVRGKAVRLAAISPGTDCYPRKNINTYINLKELNQAILFNPRNAYQNYGVAVNSSDRTIYTYMGTLLPRFGNATYSTSSQLSPLINDPYYRTIGLGTRIFLGGAQGYVAWHGTQHNPTASRNEKGIPEGGAGTIAVMGNLKQMNSRYLRGASFYRYGTTLYVGIGIPIPLLDEEMANFVGVSDEDITAPVIDYSVEKRSKPVLGKVTYKELRSGQINVQGRSITTAPLASYHRAREIASLLKQWIMEGKFLLTEPIKPLPLDEVCKPLEIKSKEMC